METRQKLKNYEIPDVKGGGRGGGEKLERLSWDQGPPSFPSRAILDSAASLRGVLIDGTPAVFTESQRD